MKDGCREFRLQFDRFLDGDLPREDASRLQKHVESCEGCRIELQGEREIAEGLGSLPELQCPERVIQRIRDAVTDQEDSTLRIDKEKSRASTFRWRWATAGLAAAAIIAYLLVGIPFMDRSDPLPVTYSPDDIRRARNTAKWSLAYAAERMGSKEKEAIEAVLHDRFPSTLKKGVRRATQPTSGGAS